MSNAAYTSACDGGAELTTTQAYLAAFQDDLVRT